MIPARIIYHGPHNECVQRKALALKQLAILHEQMKPADLKTYKRKLQFDDGSLIICRAYPGELNIIDIYIPYSPKQEEIVIKCEIFQFDYENSPDVLPKFQTKRLYTIGGYPPYFWKTDNVGYRINSVAWTNWVETNNSYVDVYADGRYVEDDCPEFDIKDSCPLGEQTLNIDRQAGCSIPHWTWKLAQDLEGAAWDDDDCQLTGSGQASNCYQADACIIVHGCSRWVMYLADYVFCSYDPTGGAGGGGAYVPMEQGCSDLQVKLYGGWMPCGTGVECADYCLGGHLDPDFSWSGEDYDFCSITSFAKYDFWCGD